MIKLFCIHDYKIIDRDVFDSKMDRVRKVGLSPTSGVDIKWFEKTMVITKECSKCGKVKLEKISV